MCVFKSAINGLLLNHKKVNAIICFSDCGGGRGNPVTYKSSVAALCLFAFGFMAAVLIFLAELTFKALFVENVNHLDGWTKKNAQSVETDS